MLRIVWRAEARADFLSIINYVADRNVTAADRLYAAIEHVVERLTSNPYMHRMGRVLGTREAVVTPNYLVVYRVGEAIEILAVLHARRRYP